MKNTNIALAIAALVGVSAVLPANASDFSRILGRFGGGSRAINYGDQAQIQSNIETGMSNLQSQISQAVASGRLNRVSAANINGEMNRGAVMNRDFLRDGAYSSTEVQSMLNEFNNINSMISSATAGAGLGTTVGYGYNNGLYNSGYGYGGNANVLSLQSRISSNISTAVSKRRMSIATASRLRSELNDLTAQLNSPRLRSSSRNSLMQQMRSLDRQVASVGGRYY